MSISSNARIQKHHFEEFCKYYELPSGTIRYGDKPDVILEGKRKIGIEITSLYLENGEGSQNEQAQIEIREEVVSQAQRLYQEKKKSAIRLTFSFETSCPIARKQELINKIASVRPETPTP